MNSSVCLKSIFFFNLAISVTSTRNEIIEGTRIDLTCRFPTFYHKWYQSYKNGKLQIGDIPEQKVNITHFSFNVEMFDENTETFCVNMNYETSNKTLIKVVSNKRREELPIQSYTESNKVEFSCLEYVTLTQSKEYISIGQINTISNKIKTHNLTSTHVFNITNNGTILCCIYYILNGTQEEVTITRVVSKKTLLLYDPSMRYDGLHSDIDNYQTVAYTIPAVVTVLLLVVIITIYRKRCRKKSSMSNSKITYANLDILRQSGLSFKRPEDESPYAEIIGEMRPPKDKRLNITE